MAPEQREKHLDQKRKKAAEYYANLTLEQRHERIDRERHHYASMAPEQREKHLDRKRKNTANYRFNMTPEQREKYLNLKVERRLARDLNVSRKEVPVELLEAKVAILNVKRKVKELMK